MLSIFATQIHMDILQANQYIARLDAEAEHHSVAFSAGRTMRWRVFGKADAAVPLVLIHGGHGSWLHWIRNIELLARDHRLFVPDLPGAGDSDDAPDGAGIQTMVDVVIAALDKLFGSSRSIDLAGFSFGGIVSAYVAAQRGAVRRLALLGSPGSDTPSRRKGEMMRWKNAPADEQNAALRNNLLTHMMYAECNVDALAFRSYADAVKATRFRGRGMAHGVPLIEILKPYANPVLFMYGEHDVICTPQLARDKLTSASSQRECRIVADSGHWVQLEGGETVNAALKQWFGHDIGCETKVSMPSANPSYATAFIG